jgi:hypothetical protein
VAKYGDVVVGNVRLEATLPRNGVSAWWKDLCRLDSEVGWFEQVVVKKMGSGNSIKFWKDIWVGDQSFEYRFPRLFNISVQQDFRIPEMGIWHNGVWRWGLLWRRNFFVWEEELVNELEELINNVIITEVEDWWEWSPDINEGFSVKSLYIALDGMLLNHDILSNSIFCV